MEKASEPFTDDLTALDWSSDGTFMVAGDRMGSIHLIDPKTLKKLGSVTTSLAAKSNNAWVEDLKISPDNKMIVFGSHGGLSKLELV
jgi:microtubule-associated protein-like 6